MADECRRVTVYDAVMDAAHRDITTSRLIVGLEIHVELATRAKMFTSIPNVAHRDHFDAPVNALIDPVTLGLPGALPVMNRAAVEMSILVGLALHCDINSPARWDRKNYSYPDLPKGYQISQLHMPLCVNGRLDITSSAGEPVRVRINRAHLEEDAGKLGHELPGGRPYDGSLVDYNRAGTPLLEIVTEPDFTDADDVVTFAQDLRTICRFLGVTEGDMQRGHIRFEPNINLELDLTDGTIVRTPIVEIKNLNSFRALRAAIEHESHRQIDQWLDDGVESGPGMKSTRGWHDEDERTFLQRSKEDAMDYRYFPEPDLPDVVVDDAWLARIAARLPELPAEKRARFRDVYGLSDAECSALLADVDDCLFFESCVRAAEDHARETDGMIARLLLNLGAKRANEQQCPLHALGIEPRQVAQLASMRRGDVIGSSAADTLFGLLCDTDDDARDVAERESLLQLSDAGLLDAWITAAIDAEPSSAADYASGKDAAAGRLIGAVMKASKGQADAKAVREALTARLRD